LESRRGVCQDFAHLAAGVCARSGSPRGTVSGYIETTPRRAGIASSAPTRRMPGARSGHQRRVGSTSIRRTTTSRTRRHVTVAWGRDYADVTPVRGVVIGPSRAQTLDVAVDVALI
jgi:transglutaminase-like putative cysteine protease